jgi:tRNA-(ms[2]io[6]A)-hydroxylase
MAERRRLPVISNTPAPAPAGEEEGDEARPPWHWVGFGTVAIFAAWLPLAYVAGALSARVMASRFGSDASKDAIDLALATMTAGERARLMATVALPSIVGLALAAFGGGFIVGRFGPGTGVREAAMAGGVVAFLASAMAWSGITSSSLVAAAVTFAVAIGFAAWGGRFGTSRRPGSGKPPASKPDGGAGPSPD